MLHTYKEEKSKKKGQYDELENLDIALLRMEPDPLV